MGKAERSPAPVGILGGLLLLTWGCAAPDRDAAGRVEVTDSAGVRIVTSSGPAWGSGEGWRLDTAAVVVMGEEDGERGQLWQVTGVTRLTDGRVAVLNSGSGEIRFFSREGRLLGAAGGMGGGPGEVQFAMGFSRGPGDTLVVLDNNGDRVFFDARGNLIRELSFSRQAPDPDHPLYFTFDAPLPDGTILGRDRPQEEERRPGTGWFRPVIHVVRKDGESHTVAEFGTYGEIQQEMLDVGSQSWPIVPPFARTTAVGFGGDDLRVVVGDNDRFELRVFDGNGTLLQLVRLTVEAPRVTDDEVEEWKERQRTSSWVEGQLPQLERGWAQMRVPESKPSFGSELGVSTHGYLWVAEYTDPQNRPSRLHLFDPQGAYLGDLGIPDGLSYFPRTLEMGPDYLLAVFMDDFDVETVRLYPIITDG
jgi:hypothetical protein